MRLDEYLLISKGFRNIHSLLFFENNALKVSIDDVILQHKPLSIFTKALDINELHCRTSSYPV